MGLRLLEGPRAAAVLLMTAGTLTPTAEHREGRRRNRQEGTVVDPQGVPQQDPPFLTVSTFVNVYSIYHWRIDHN